MRKIGILIAVLLVSLMLVAGCAKQAPATPASVNKPSLVIIPTVAPLDSGTQIVFMGSDYKPGQEIAIMVREPFSGALVNIAPQLAPPDPVANDQGCWAGVWTLGSYVTKAVFTEGVYSFQTVDENKVTLASASLGLVDTKQPKEKWPAWGQSLPEPKK
jgi:hypothetical protein